jgi:hypothetical protein
LLVFRRSFQFHSPCGQTISSSGIAGVVHDPAGLSINGASITITNNGTREVRKARTEADGFFEVLNLPAGAYRMEDEKEGFAVWAEADLQLEVGHTPRFEIAMRIGNTSEQVTVTEKTPMVESQSVAVGQVIDCLWARPSPVGKFARSHPEYPAQTQKFRCFLIK